MCKLAKRCPGGTKQQKDSEHYKVKGSFGKEGHSGNQSSEIYKGRIAITPSLYSGARGVAGRRCHRRIRVLAHGVCGSKNQARHTTRMRVPWQRQQCTYTISPAGGRFHTIIFNAPGAPALYQGAGNQARSRFFPKVQCYVGSGTQKGHPKNREHSFRGNIQVCSFKDEPTVAGRGSYLPPAHDTNSKQHTPPTR